MKGKQRAFLNPYEDWRSESAPRYYSAQHGGLAHRCICKLVSIVAGSRIGHIALEALGDTANVRSGGEWG